MQVAQRASLEPDAVQAGIEATIEGWIAELTADGTSRSLIRRQLDSIKTTDALVAFIHRFVVFNDALAARVPFLSGTIHLNTDYFVDDAAETAFGRMRSAQVSGYVALAAADEYEMDAGINLVHQFLSQEFLRRTLAFYGIDGATFDQTHPVPDRVQAVLREVRSTFLTATDPYSIFAALGFHIGLEYFATEEFSLLDNHLRECYTELVEDLNGDQFGYSWVSTHTIVEVRHYQAGLRALSTAVTSYCDPEQRPAMLARAHAGLAAFVDLQRRFYSAILDDRA